MRRLLLMAIGGLMFGGVGCSLPTVDPVEERQFWKGDCPRDLLGMEAKPADTATQDRTHGGVR